MTDDPVRDAGDPVGDAAASEDIAQAKWWLDDAAGCLSARERAYRLYRAAGDDRGAARAAVALGYDAALFGEGVSVAQGWLSRARELLRSQTDTVPEHGWLAAREAELALNVTHQPDIAVEAGTRAAEIGAQLGVVDLEFVGHALAGLAVVRRGEPADGLRVLNESVAAALAGEVSDPMWMGKICCWLVAACYETQDLSRALEWCARVERVCRERGLMPLFDVCRIMYASVQLDSGEWVDAEHQLLAVLDRMQTSRRGSRVDAVIALGELRRRQGRLDEAENLFARAEFDVRAILGRALILMDRGQAPLAWAQVDALLSRIDESDTLVRARVLRAATRCANASGDTERAATAARELAVIAGSVATPSLAAHAAEAAAIVASPDLAAASWRRAVRLFHDAGLPFDEAEARLGLASSLPPAHPEAQAQSDIAERVLANLGVVGRTTTHRTDRLRPLDGRADQLSSREREVLRLVADGMTNTQISENLGVSPHTVHRHVANILTKLGAPTRAAAVSSAERSGQL
ncbi:LuxR C-terminal-related transcriptional regulator [Microbacterium sp. P02]|uniref:LuxR C-terminal-related transcriptional regulator n=1 Tax=Microbacterium sp. P02 TaxID=3366260 RepID=UPI003670CA57